VFLAFAGLLGYAALVHGSRERERVQRDVLTHAQTLAQHVEFYLATRIDLLAGLADTASRGGGLDSQLRLAARSYADLASIVVVDGRGGVLGMASSGRGPVRPGDTDLAGRGASGGRVAVGEPRRAGADVVVGLYVATDRAPNGPSGVAAIAELSLRSIQALFGQLGLGAETVTEILTPGGLVVARGPVPAAVTGTRAGARYPDLLRGEHGAEIAFEDGVRRLVGAALIRPAGWVVAVGRPLATVETDAWKPLVLSGAGAAAALALALVLALPLVRRTSEGLERLRGAMSRLEAGDIPANLPVTVGGEVGALTEGFNRLLGGLRTRLSDYKAMSRVEQAANSAIAGERPFREVLIDLLRNVVRGMEADAGVALLREPEGLVVRAAVGLWSGSVEGVALPRGRLGVAGAVIEGRRVTIVSDTEADGLAVEPYVEAARLRSLIGAPMVSRGQVVGVVEVGYRTPHSFAVAEVHRTEAMVGRMVQAYEHARALEAEPDLSARAGILKRRAALEGVALPDELAEYMAGEITGSIREVEGALTRILAFSDLTGRELGRELVDEFLVNIWRPEGHEAPARARRPQFLAIVQRGATELFEMFRQHFDRSGLVEVVWDRRVGPRRRGREVAVPERRRGDRRRKISLGPDRHYVLIRREAHSA
jgi:HAMP domain-containing protein/putative methionine-R-sulfoxide reductase with GAF domain